MARSSTRPPWLSVALGALALALAFGAPEAAYSDTISTPDTPPGGAVHYEFKHVWSSGTLTIPPECRGATQGQMCRPFNASCGAPGSQCEYMQQCRLSQGEMRSCLSTLSIYGVVVDKAGNKVENARVVVMDTGLPPRLLDSMRTLSGGNYAVTIDAPVGTTYVVAANKESYSSQWARLMFLGLFSQQGNWPDTTLVLQPDPIEISGFPGNVSPTSPPFSGTVAKASVDLMGCVDLLGAGGCDSPPANYLSYKSPRRADAEYDSPHAQWNFTAMDMLAHFPNGTYQGHFYDPVSQSRDFRQFTVTCNTRGGNPWNSGNYGGNNTGCPGIDCGVGSLVNCGTCYTAGFTGSHFSRTACPAGIRGEGG